MKLKGSYTVEMSLIMPMLLAVIILVIYSCLYSHDLAVREYNLTRVLVGEGSGITDEYNSDDIERELIENLSKNTAGKWTDEIKVSIYKEGDIKKLSVESRGRMGHSQGLLDKLIGGRVFGIQNIASHAYVHEPDYIKNLR